MSKTIQKLLSLLLCLVMALSLFPAAALAEEPVGEVVPGAPEETTPPSSQEDDTAPYTGETEVDPDEPVEEVALDVPETDAAEPEGASTDYTLSGNPRDDLIAVAAAQEGKTAADFGFSVAWCAYFVSWCGRIAAPDLFPSSLQPYGKDLVVNMANNNKGVLYYFTDDTLASLQNGDPYVDFSTGNYVRTDRSSFTPEPGDLITFCNEEYQFKHIGIVCDVDSSYVYYIDGNGGGSSAGTTMTRPVRTYVPIARDSNSISTYLRPNYPESTNNESTSQIQVASSDSFGWPVASKHINALDHYSNGSEHGGIDIAASNQSNVYSVAPGTVVRIGNGCSHYSSGSGHNCYATDGWGEYGNYVVLKHVVGGTTYTSVYAHLTQNSILVSVGDTVTAGQLLAKSGSSGSSTGPHLHLEIYEGEFRGGIKTIRSKSFQYYQNNAAVLNGMSFSSHVNSSSVYFGSWVEANCELSNGVWTYKGGSQGDTNPPSISGAVYPSGTLTQGESFGLRGTISSGSKLSNVSAYVYNASGAAVLSYSANPNSYSYNIQTDGLNDQFTFGVLAAGNYRYVVKATNSNGTATLIDSSFTIGGTSSGLVSMNDASVFLKGDTRSTLITNTMMLRRRAILDGDSTWSSITTDTVASVGWVDGSGMSFDYTYGGKRVYSYGVPSELNLALGDLSARKTYFINNLASHPEGIVLYVHFKTDYKKCVLLTDYDASTDTFYCADPSTSSGNGRIRLADSILPSCIKQSYPNTGLSDQDLAIAYTQQTWMIIEGSGATTTYTVSFNANGGTGAPASQTKTRDVPLTLSSTKPSRANASAGSCTVTLDPNGGSVSSTSLTAARTTSYTFKNWNTAANGSGTSYASGASYTSNSAATLYAQWNSSTTTAAVTLPTPTRTGYSFRGWSDDSSATSGTTGSYTPTGNVTLYAVWDPWIYTITYNANGGTGAPANQTKTHDVALTLSTTRPTRADASAGSYTVTLDPNGGSVSTSSLTAACTTSYSFKDWNTAANGSGTSYASGASYTVNSGVTLYAQWNSSTATAAVTLPTPTREGYSFLGWATGATAAEGVTGSYTPSGNVTLYAIWQQNQVEPDPDALTLTFGDAEARPGETFTVTLQLTNNPGIKGISAEVVYDESVMTLVSATPKISAGTWSVETIAEDHLIYWYNTDAFTGTDVVELTFTVADSAEEGEYAIGLQFGDWDSVVGPDNNEIESFNIVPGTLTVTHRIPGDINGDGKVGLSDVVLLATYVKARGNGVTIVPGSGDVNGDGKVNAMDVALLATYVKARGNGVVIH